MRINQIQIIIFIRYRFNGRTHTKDPNHPEILEVIFHYLRFNRLINWLPYTVMLCYQAKMEAFCEQYSHSIQINSLEIQIINIIIKIKHK